MPADLHFNWPLLVDEAVRRRKALRLTRGRLAARAKVTIEAVARFEEGKTGTRISAVLAILTALGMDDKRDLKFDGSFYIDIDDSVLAWSYDRGVQVRCRIMYDALTALRRPKPKDERTEWIYMAVQRKLEAVARRKYMLGRIEPNGEVVVRKEDL